MRRKLGILFLIGITVLAGTQEAAQQFDGLKSSLKDFTRASLWSGLIVYAQPVNDGKLPTPQIYYLMPTPQQPITTPAAQQQPVLADNNGNGGGGRTAAAQPEARNNHGEEAAAAASNPDAGVFVAAAREVEDAAKSELALDKLPLNLVGSPFVAPKAEKVRAYEEVARVEPHAARRFRQEAAALTKVYAREFDAARIREIKEVDAARLRDLDAVKLAAEAERLVSEHGQLERLKSKTLGEADALHRRMELRMVRRPAPRPERHERIRVIVSSPQPRGVVMPEMSSIGCEKTRRAPEVAPAAPAPAAAPVAKKDAQAVSEVLIELGLQPATTGNSWTLNCDTEPEQK